MKRQWYQQQHITPGERGYYLIQNISETGSIDEEALTESAPPFLYGQALYTRASSQSSIVDPKIQRAESFRSLWWESKIPM